jgi:DNA-binding CsgD family transcriptional regulator
MAVHARRPEITERQRMVVAHVRQGYSNREIGEKLGISEDGVKAHLSRLYLRYGVTNRVELITTVDETNGYPSAVVTPPSGTSRAREPLTRTPARTSVERSAPALAAAAKLTAVREALLAVDAALGLVSELPPETTELMISAVKRRLGDAITALDEAQRGVVISIGGSAAI